MKKLLNIYKKNEEVLNYLVVGGLTTVVSILVFALFNNILNFDYRIASVISWIFAVAFAYFTNKTFVFKTRNKTLKETFIESIKFFSSRIFSLIVDLGIIILLVEVFKLDELISKIIVQLIIVILNYILSKFIVFKKTK